MINNLQLLSYSTTVHKIQGKLLQMKEVQLSKVQAACIACLENKALLEAFHI
jgi:hypothetical protein